jgi:small-conductance mechanosensitive channel
MITTEISTLSAECKSWRDALRSEREKLTRHKSDLGELATSETNPELMTEIGHLDNQFYIQLINIHELRQAIKRHDRMLTDQDNDADKVSEHVLAKHDTLFDDYQSLETILHNLRQEFDFFVRQARVF